MTVPDESSRPTVPAKAGPLGEAGFWMCGRRERRARGDPKFRRGVDSGPRSTAPERQIRRQQREKFTWAKRLLLAMADLGAHASLLATLLAATLAGLLGTHR
jgi:hypothetical protein